MKVRFKTIVLSALAAMAAFTSVTYTSCKEDKCKAIVCAYGGICKEGVCICPSGYEGYQCETIIRDKFKGVWTVFEKGTTTLAAQYEISIEYGPTMTDMYIRNFYNKFTAPVEVRLKGDTMYINQQTVEGHVVQGKGYIEPSKYYGKNGEMKVKYSVKTPDGRVNDFGVTIGDISVWSR